MDIMILSVVWGGGGNRKLNNKSVSLIHHQTCTVAFLAMTREYYKNLWKEKKNLKFIESVSGHITHDLFINF